MIEKPLKTLGLKALEVKVISSLVELRRPAKSRDVAGLLQLPRQTVYSTLLNLARKGLVVQSSKAGIRYFYSDAKVITTFVDLQRDALAKVKSAIKGDRSRSVVEVAKSKLPDVQFYEGASGLRVLFENILNQYKKGKSKNFRGYGINHFSDSKPLVEYLDYFVRKRFSYGVKTKLLIAKGPDDFNITSEAKTLGRKVKHLDIDPQMAGVYLVGDRVYLFSYADNVGVMIKNKAIFSMLKHVFDDHWDKTSA